MYARVWVCMHDVRACVCVYTSMHVYLWSSSICELNIVIKEFLMLCNIKHTLVTIVLKNGLTDNYE